MKIILNTADFLDKVCSTSLIPQITSPAKLAPRSKTLIDNTDSNTDTTLGNIATNTSDHLAQFLLLPNKSKPT